MPDLSIFPQAGAGAPRCFVTRRLPGDALDRLAAVCDVDVWEGRLPPAPAELRRRATHADGLLCLLTDQIDSQLLDECRSLRAISTYAVGYDNIDVAAATARGIPVGHTPDVLTEATADLAFALLLAAARRLPDARANVLDGEWRTWEPGALLGQSVHGATLGIIGPGRIGQAVARRAEGFGMTVLTSGRSGSTSLDTLLGASDFVSLHCPLTDETRRLIDARALSLMKPTAVLVNTARGGVVDQQALAAALHEGRIFAAALDVTDPEPLPSDDPLLRAPNLLVVPHIASATVQARSRMTSMAVDNLIAGLRGEPMPHPVPRP